MPLADINTSLPAVAGLDPVEFLLTLAVFVVMIAMFTMCTCCGNEKHNRDLKDEADYGVVTVSGNPQNLTKSTAHINFRPNPTKGPHERHSQPATNMLQNMLTFNRQSAPGRALPKLPADLYTAIDKKAKRGGAVTAAGVDDIRFVDETVNPMYECIDAETDSFVDPLYSKVGDVPGTSAARDRKYDYPIFSGRQKRPQEDTVYQSASQIYAPNSEDPYSSITSGRNQNQDDGDNSSAYDPGYAKVNLNVKAKEDKKKDKIEKTERELDLLYSKIRRNDSNYRDGSQPGPSNRPEPILPTYPIADPVPPPSVPFDEQSAVSSREPSYRYITMRENADVVRERLRQQGQLDQPRREHYYSTIGNEYETIANGSISQNPQTPITIDTGRAPLANISTSSILDAPPPPTSPIPGRSRPVSYIDPYGTVAIPPPPDLRCSPVPPRPPGEEPHVFSISHASSSGLPRVSYSIDCNDAYTLPTTANRTSFRSMETLLGKRTVEEKETIVEQRSTFATGVPVHQPPTDMMSRSMDSREARSAVHQVPIRRLDRNYDGGGPSVDVIISGRRYRAGQGVVEEPEPAKVEAEDVPGTSTSDKPPSRTKSSSDKEDDEPSKSNRSARNKKGWKDESEEERVQRLGTIYTANDYVCPMDMTDQKPWPMSGSGPKN